MKKNRGFGKLHEGTVTVFVISWNFSFIMCVALQRKEIWFLRIEKIIYMYPHHTSIKNGQVPYWSLKIKIYMIYL